MKKALFVILLSVTNLCSAQKDIYKELYQQADLIKSNKMIGVLDNNIYKVADSLSKMHPTGFFKSSSQYLGLRKFNEAAFLYYLGYFRYNYYNSSNPNYKPTGDGALASSLLSVLGEPIKMYLHANIENFISLLNSTNEYLKTHDYPFYPKERNIEKYNLQLTNAASVLEDLKTKKKAYKKEWKKEREEFENPKKFKN